MPSLQSTRYALRGAVAKYFEQPAADALSRIGFTPARATLAGLALVCIGAYAAGTGRFWQAGVLNALGSLFDLLDGSNDRPCDHK